MEWALQNIGVDIQEEAEKFTSILQGLKPWLNFDLYKAEEETKRSPPIPSSTYIDALRKRGVSEEELKEIIGHIDALKSHAEANVDQANRKATISEGVETGDEEGDRMTVLTSGVVDA